VLDLGRRVAALRGPRIPGCGQDAASAPALRGASSTHVEVPGTPAGLAAVPGGDGALVALPGYEGSALARLRRMGEEWAVSGVVELAEGWIPRGIALASGGARAIVAAGPGLLFADPATAAVLGSIAVPAALFMQVALDLASRYAFATDEDRGVLAVFDLGSEEGAASLVGECPVPPGPVGVALAPDGEHVLVTSQHDARGGQPGVLTVLPVAALVADPAGAAGVAVPAGCQPVRVAVGGDGSGLAWVTARGSNALLGFDCARLVDAAGGGGSRRRPGALRAVVRVGAAPVGVAVTGGSGAAGGARVVVANSNRYAGRGEPQSLSVVGASAALTGAPALLGTVPAGVFPREVVAVGDGRTVLVANFDSRTVQVVTLPE
jgi:DNA-binding beta-propeller fold protein YncE